MRVLFIFLIFIFVAQASVADEKISLEELRAYALSNSPNVKEIDASFASALKESLSAGTLKNPEIEGLISHPKSKGAQELDGGFEVSLIQPLRLSDFGSRDRLRDLMDEASSLERKLSLLELSQKFKLAYARLWALQEKSRIFSSAKERATKFSKLVSRSFASGLVGKGQSLAFEAEVSRQEAKLLGINADVYEAKASLTSVVGKSLENITLSKPLLSRTPEEREILDMLSDLSFPPIVLSDLRLKLSKAQNEVAKRDAFPSLVPKFFYAKNSEGFDEYGGGISIEIPLWDQNKGEINKSKAESEYRSSRNDYVSGSGFKEEILHIQRYTEQTVRQAKLYETDVVPKLQKSLSELTNQHQAGASSVFEVLNSQRELLEVEQESLDLYVKAISAQIELSVLSGTEF